MPFYELDARRPSLGRNVFVADSAAIVGDVHLGDDSSVWFGAVVRGDFFPIRIGARTNIQDNAVVHITSARAATTIGEDVTVGHAAILHGCTVGALCLIGMASVVLDGAVVGEGSLLGAGSLVTPGTVIAPRSFALGRPAKVIRPIRDDELLSIRGSAENYVRYGREFQLTCTRLPSP